VSGHETGAGFAIEVRQRYRDVVRDRWPLAVAPQPYELLSSWLHRLAIANGVAPRSFAGVLGLGVGMWSARLDLRVPSDIADLLRCHVGVCSETISAMTLASSAPWPLLPLRQHGDRNRSTWLQFCPRCLAGDEAPYFRRHWRLATRISCFEHGSGLRDRCPACRGGIAAFDQAELVPQHFCARCGFDLRKAPKASAKVSARQLERSIDDIIRLEATKGWLKKSDLFSRLLRAPMVAGVRSARMLTNLSSSARIRCFERLADKPDDWLVAGDDTAAAHWRRRILVAGGHSRLIARLADVMERHHGSFSLGRAPDADLAKLLEAYAGLTERRSAARDRVTPDAKS
jgi:hypothetical protein